MTIPPAPGADEPNQPSSPTPDGVPVSPPIPPTTAAFPPPGYPYPQPGYAPPGYAPPGYPPYGYAPAPGYPVQGGWPAPWNPWQASPEMLADPLVTPIVQGFSGWWARLWQTVARSWRPLLIIQLITMILPSLALTIAAAAMLAGRQFGVSTTASSDSATTFDVKLGPWIAVLSGGLLAALAMLFLGGLGAAASIWTLTRQGAGQPAPLGQAFAYGLRNCVRVGGWWLLYELAIGIGAVCCIAPGLYLLVAGALTIPMAVFRAGGFGQSIGMVNRNFGRVLGRLASVVGIGLATSMVGYAISAAFGSPFDFAPISTTNRTSYVYPSLGAGEVAGIIVQDLSGLLTIMLAIIGATLTYFEMRNRENPISTVQLATML